MFPAKKLIDVVLHVQNIILDHEPQRDRVILAGPLTRASRDGRAYIVKCAQTRQFAFDGLGEKQ